LSLVKSSRSVALAIAVVILAGVVLVAALVGANGVGTTPVTSITTPSPATTSATSVAAATPTGSASPSRSASLLDERFGFLLYCGSATVLSETSDAAITSFAIKGRSFTSLARMVSPDGRLVAYWDPVDSGPVLHVRPVTGGTARMVLTGGPEMSGNAFTWSSDSTGLVAALDNNRFGFGGGPQVGELWTIDLAGGATEKIASGSIWLPVTWDRGAKLVAAGVTGEGGYLTGYDVVDLRQQPYAMRSTPFRPTVIGRLKASSDARYVLLSVDGGASSSLAWWPLAEPDKRSAVAFAGIAADWRPGTSEMWWVDGLTPPGCRIAPCGGTELVAFDVSTGGRRMAFRGSYGSTLVGFRVDGSAAITQTNGSTTELVVTDLTSGLTARVPIGGQFGGPLRLR
jgi:hypothetical protein